MVSSSALLQPHGAVLVVLLGLARARDDLVEGLTLRVRPGRAA